MSKNILVADDDPAICTIIVKALEAVGVEDTAVASDGDEALALVADKDVDIHRELISQLWPPEAGR